MTSGERQELHLPSEKAKMAIQGNYRIASCTLVLEKIVDKVISEDISGHMKKIIWNSYHGFAKVFMPNRLDHLS